jgi:hypothetical protein
MNIEQLTILKSITRETKCKTRLGLIKTQLTNVKLIEGDSRFNLVMDIRNLVNNRI